MRIDDDADDSRTRTRFRGALVGGAIGDALGAPFEGGQAGDRLALEGLLARPPEAMRYTDDTALTLATARSMVEREGIDLEHMAAALAAAYEREPWRGYGVGTPRVFEQFLAGASWREAAPALFGGHGSFGNGAAMRIAPIGLLHHGEPRTAAAAARDVARITHAHPVGQDGAALQAAAVAALVAEATPGGIVVSDFIDRLKRCSRTRRMRDLLDAAEELGESAEREAVVDLLGNGVEAHRSVITALYAFLRHRDSFADAIMFALELGGDTDTIASMTGALAGAALGEGAIPAAWTTVEGSVELRGLADRLLRVVLARRAR